MQIQGLLFGEAVKVGIFRTIWKVSIKASFIPSIFSASSPKPKAIFGVLLAFVDLAADAGNADDRGGHVHDLGQVFQGDHLPEVIPALALLPKVVDELAQPGRRFHGLLEPGLDLGALHLAVLRQKFLQKAAALQVIQQFLGIVFRLSDTISCRRRADDKIRTYRFSSFC